MKVSLIKWFLTSSILIFINSCSFYYENICINADPRVKLIQKIVDNPEDIIQLITSSKFCSEDITKKINYIITIADQDRLIRIKGLELKNYFAQEINSGYTIGLELPREKRIKTVIHYGFVVNGIDDGLFVVYQKYSDKWILKKIVFVDRNFLDEYKKSGIPASIL